MIDESEANKRITAMRSSLDESVDRLFGWGRVRRTASKVPWLPLALGGSTALVAIFGGGNESGKDFLTKSTIAMMRQHQWQALFLQATIMLFWIFVCLYCLYLIIVPAVATGFNVKKALFSGGRLSSPENNLFNKPPYYYVKWQDFPERNIYRVEQDVFAALGARKEPEFQVDLVFSMLPYMMCSAVALLGAIVLASSVGRWSVLVFAVVTLGLILEAIDERRLYQRRRMAGNY